MEPLFESGKAFRYDVNSDVVLLRMLKAGRVDVALFDEYTALWVIHSSPEMSMSDFYIAEQELGNSDLRFAFNRHPGWEARLPEVNARIQGQPGGRGLRKRSWNATEPFPGRDAKKG